MRERTLESDQLCVSTAELACDVKRSGLNTDHGAGDGCWRRPEREQIDLDFGDGQSQQSSRVRL